MKQGQPPGVIMTREAVAVQFGYRPRWSTVRTVLGLLRARLLRRGRPSPRLSPGGSIGIVGLVQGHRLAAAEGDAGVAPT
jgi:hypothetical protein